MEQLQIGDGELLSLHVRDMVGSTGLPAPQQAQPARQQAAAPARGGRPDPETLRLQLLGNPQLRQNFIALRPEMADIIEDSRQFAQALQNIENRELEEQNRRRQYIADLNADPFDLEAQTRIEEMIREERVQENLQNAIEHNPEGQYLSSYPGNRSLLWVSLWQSSYVIYRRRSQRTQGKGVC